MDVKDKTVVVAGGAGSLGGSIVTALCERGARVACLDLRDAAEPAERVFSVRADLTDDAAVAAAIENICAHLGNVSVLVNCAGSIHSEPLIALTNREQPRHSRASWDRVIAGNLTSAFVVGSQIAQHMAAHRTKGVIVNFSSIAAGGNPGQTAYAAAKAGIEAMTRVWARELGPMRIRAVAIAPGFVDTESTRAAMPETALQDLKRRTPLLRLGSPQDIVSAVMFALENDFLTGTTIAVDGGLVL